MRRLAEITPPVTWKSRWRNFGSLWEKALDLQTVFRADLAGACQALAKDIEKRVLTPKEIPLGRCWKPPVMWARHRTADSLFWASYRLGQVVWNQRMLLTGMSL
jgi:hypothetical protein